MSWILEGKRVRGLYLDKFPVEGTVYHSRVAYGGAVDHHITLDTPITVYGAVRDTVILERSKLEIVNA